MTRGLIAGACAVLWGGMATAQTCVSYPNALTNGATADARQMIANFNCAALFNRGDFIVLRG